MRFHRPTAMNGNEKKLEKNERNLQPHKSTYSYQMLCRLQLAIRHRTFSIVMVIICKVFMEILRITRWRKPLAYFHKLLFYSSAFIFALVQCNNNETDIALHPLSGTRSNRTIVIGCIVRNNELRYTDFKSNLEIDEEGQ